MRTGKYYTLKEPLLDYYGYEMGEKYECVDGGEDVLRSPNDRGWQNLSYGQGNFLYVNDELFVETHNIFIGGE